MADFDLTRIPSQNGKIAIVTGSNAGLGYENAKALASKDILVILACRNHAKATSAKESILEEFPTAKIDIILLDLSSLNAVRKFAAEFLYKYSQLDILVNNAGIMMPPYRKTEDDLESQMAANCFGHFLLTGLLMDQLLATENSRIVWLASIAHRNGIINFYDLQSEKEYSKMGAYSQSKLACLMYAYELQRRFDGMKTSTISVAAHPGISTTELSRHLPSFLMILQPVAKMLVAQSPKDGAEPQIYACLGDDIVGGDYTGPNGFREFRGRATKVKSTKASMDQKIGLQLWEESERITGIKYPK